VNLAEAASGVRALRVEPDVYDRIRPMVFHDADAVARLHHAAMGDSTWARLGLRFLTALYKTLINTSGFIAFVYLEDNEVRGFIAGSTDPDAMMSTVFRKAWFILGPAALPHGLRPSTLKKLLQTPRYKKASNVPGMPDVPAESLFCSFAPELRGKRVAGAINKVLFDDLLARGHQFVKITTETSNEGANRQLRSWGFVDLGRFEFYGKEMVTYVLDLKASPRVEAVGRHPMVE